MRNSRSQILQNPGAADIKTDRIEVSYLPIAQLELNPRNHRRDPRSGHPVPKEQLATDRGVESLANQADLLLS
jgi:hypothetical protein